jgi:hypothetical protein
MKDSLIGARTTIGGKRKIIGVLTLKTGAFSI